MEIKKEILEDMRYNLLDALLMSGDLEQSVKSVIDKLNELLNIK